MPKMSKAKYLENIGDTIQETEDRRTPYHENTKSGKHERREGWFSNFVVS
jgi:hypothetical protein